jgi:hypothetical protein
VGHTTEQVLAAASVPASERTKAQRDAVASDPNRQSVRNAAHEAEKRKSQGVK